MMRGVGELEGRSVLGCSDQIGQWDDRTGTRNVLSMHACRRRFAETWEDWRRADAMEVRRSSTHSLHSSAVPAAAAVSMGAAARS
jgi:hypothetical protein